MRLWHKDLIPFLSREHLVAQWRECSAICSNILSKGTPNHILVNKIMEYPIEHFVWYSMYVRLEMTKRGYKTMEYVAEKYKKLYDSSTVLEVDYNELFSDWHTDRYLMQCLTNLQEKADCGLAVETWEKIAAEPKFKILIQKNGGIV